MFLLLLFFFLCCCCVDFLKSSAKQKWNWRLVFINRKKITVETIIINTPSEDSTETYPMLLLLLLPMFYFLCRCWVDCLKISVIRKWNWKLVETVRNIRTAEALTVNTPSRDWTELTLWRCCFCCSLFCAVAANIVWIKTVPLNFYHIIKAQTCTVLTYTYYKIMINKEEYF